VKNGLGPDARKAAREFARAKFAGVVDKGGNDYIFHCDKVAEKVEHLGDDYYVVGMLHDVFEDCYEDEAGKCAWAEFERDLKEAGVVTNVYNVDVLHAIRALSKRKGEDYFDYLNRLACYPMAIDVKLADLYDNMDIERIPEKERGPADYERLGKYKMATKYLRALRSLTVTLNEGDWA